MKPRALLPPYLISALLVLLGGHLMMARGGSASPPRELFTVQIAYQAAALLALAMVRHRDWRGTETAALVTVHTVFLLDGMLLQRHFGWDGGGGALVATLGCAAGLISLVALAALLRLPLTGPLLGVMLLATAFVRFAPALLAGAREPSWGVVPRYVGLGWLLAGCLLPALLTREPHRPRRLEAAGLLACLCLLLMHFTAAGASYGLRFHVAYLAPFVVLLSPLLAARWDRLAPSPSLERLKGFLPYLGLALSASELTPGLIDSRWARTWPLTPFFLCLLVLIALHALEALHSGAAGQAYAAAFLLCLALLGGSPAEVLTGACFPADWQVVATLAVAWVLILRLKHFRLGLLLQVVPAFVLASWASAHGYPMAWSLPAALAWGTLLLEAVTRQPLPRSWRLLVTSLVTLLAAAGLLAAPRSPVHLGFAALQCVLAFLVGRWRDDLLLRRLAALAAAAALAGWFLVTRDYRQVESGHVLVALGFLALAAAAVNSLAGERIRRHARAWLAASAHPPEAGA